MEHPDAASKLLAKLYDIFLLVCVQCQAPDDGQRNCPKHAEFHSKNKSEELLYLVDCIIGNLKTVIVFQTIKAIIKS